MKRYRVTLAASLVFLAAALMVLWLALGHPMPSAELACRLLERERLITNAETVASGPIRFQHDHSEDAWWFIRRSGDDYTLITLDRLAFVLWRPKASWDSPALTAQNPIHLYLAGTTAFGVMGDNGHTHIESEWVVVGVSVDPAIVRMEAILCEISHERDCTVGEYVEAWGITVPMEETAPGSGVWTAPPTVVHREEGGSSGYWACRGYDAQGALVSEYIPNLWSYAQ